MLPIQKNFSDNYLPLTSDEDIVVNVKIGEGQRGDYQIFLGAKPYPSNKPATLGKKADVLGKTTLIAVTIVDILKETNCTSVTVILTEGPEHKTVFGPYTNNPVTSGDTTLYTIKLLHL